MKFKSELNNYEYNRRVQHLRRWILSQNRFYKYSTPTVSILFSMITKLKCQQLTNPMGITCL
jgi:hypothetical protein